MKITGIAWNHNDSSFRVRFTGLELVKIHEDAEALLPEFVPPPVPLDTSEVDRLQEQLTAAREALAEIQAEAQEAEAALRAALVEGAPFEDAESRFAQAEAKASGVKKRIALLEQLLTDAKARLASKTTELVAQANVEHDATLQAELQAISDKVEEVLGPLLPRLKAVLESIVDPGID